jgi:hypothetical protein
MSNMADELPDVLKAVHTRPLFVMHLNVRKAADRRSGARCLPPRWRGVRWQVRG